MFILVENCILFQHENSYSIPHAFKIIIDSVVFKHEEHTRTYRISGETVAVDFLVTSMIHRRRDHSKRVNESMSQHSPFQC